MKNKILFLIIGMFILIGSLGFTSASLNWSKSLTINSSLPDVGTFSTPTVFEIGTDWYLISGNGIGNYFGYAYNGADWVSNASIISGLARISDESAPEVFYWNNNYYLIAGTYDGYLPTFALAANHTTWIKNTTMNNSLPVINFKMKPSVFIKSGTLYLILGDYEGKFYGYNWSGSAWQKDLVINNSLPQTAFTEVAPDVFNISSSYYMLVGENGGDTIGFNWTGTAWKNDTTMNKSLPDLGTRVTPSLFLKDSIWYNILGSQAGTFFGYIGEFAGASSILVNITFPTNHSILTQSNLFNVSLSMTETNLSYSWVNNTYYIWYSNGTRKNITTVTGLSTNSTSTSKLFTLGFGNYKLDSYACYSNLTYSNCSWGVDGNISFSVNSSINSETHNAVGYETASETYTLNLTSPTTPTNAYLVYNGTSYAATVANMGGNIYTLSKTLQVNSTMIGSNTFYYSWNLSSTFSENTTTYNQFVNYTHFGLCNATLTVPYLNITFKDEGSLAYILASIPSSTFVYYLGDGSVNKTLTFVNTTANSNYAFCSFPSNKTYYIDSYVQYKNDTSYPQRIWDELMRTYTNVTTNKTLYLLDSADGIYVTYQVLDGVGNQLSDVEIMVNRTIEGSDYIIGTGITDSSGSSTFWLNPDFAHSLSFSKTGYETFYLAQFPTQASYTVTLGQTSSGGVNDYIRGVVYTIQPNFGITLNVSQLYNFNMTMNSSYWTLDSFGFILYGDELVIGGNSSSTSYGFISNTLNVSSYDHIRIRVYWVINGTTIYGENNGWFTFDYEEGTGWSIKNFFSDLSKYAGEGMFGLTTNALNFIIFIIIFVFTGIVSYKFSFTSPAVVSGIIFALVFLFDVGLGLISMPFLAVLHFPTIFMLLITVALAIWEVRR